MRSCLGADTETAILETYSWPMASARKSDATAKNAQLNP